MASSSDLKYQFDSKEGAKKFFYAYKNVLMKGKTEEEEADRLVANLNAETFEYYFDHFTDVNDRTEEATSFQNINAALL